jgi:hypothetical protein
MQQYFIINRLSSFVCLPSSVICPLHLSRALYKSALFMQNKPNFAKAQMNINVYSTMDYENISDWTLGKNKPNSNPIKPNSNPISEMPKMNVNTYPTRAYSNKTAFRRIQNKPNQTQSSLAQTIQFATLERRVVMAHLGRHWQTSFTMFAIKMAELYFPNNGAFFAVFNAKLLPLLLLDYTRICGQISNKCESLLKAISGFFVAGRLLPNRP